MKVFRSKYSFPLSFISRKITGNRFSQIANEGVYLWTGTEQVSGDQVGILEGNQYEGVFQGIRLDVDGSAHAVVAIQNEQIGGEIGVDGGVAARASVSASLDLTVLGNRVYMASEHQAPGFDFEVQGNEGGPEPSI